LNTQILTAILAKDSKDSTYKYALLRAMMQCVKRSLIFKNYNKQI